MFRWMSLDMCRECHVMIRRVIKNNILLTIIVVLSFVFALLHLFVIRQLDVQDKGFNAEVSASLDAKTLFLRMCTAYERSHVMDSTGEYLIVRNIQAPVEAFSFRPSTASANSSTRYDITLVTQCSVNHLHQLLQLAQVWSGPISLTVFSVEKHLSIAFDVAVRIFVCNPELLGRVALHLVVPLTLGRRRLVQPRVPRSDVCKDLSSVLERRHGSEGQNYGSSNVAYPNNLLRNVALDSAVTGYVLVVDVDMIPKVGLFEGFHKFTRDFSDRSAETERTAFVVPSFELEEPSSGGIPADKKTLVRLWYKKVVRPFYEEVCWKCQRQTNYYLWRNLSATRELTVGFEAEWKDPWEPFYVVPRTAPRYDERFKQYGFNRISQSCELHVAGFRFFVLNNAFLIHKGFKLEQTFHARKQEEADMNRMLFRKFKQELKQNYPDSELRC